MRAAPLQFKYEGVAMTGATTTGTMTGAVPASGASNRLTARTPAPQSGFAPWKDPSKTPIVRFENVTKKFGDFVAIDNVTLDIYEREFFALLGPSGCGKTTLLRMLAGFETPSEGRIIVAGNDITGIAPYERTGINMMFQSYALFPHMTVESNVGFGLRQEKMSKADIDARVNEAMSLVELTKFAKRKPHQLSGGQQQRVALARAIAKKPKLMLLDEPLGALDKKLRNQSQFELMRIQERTATTFVIVTHDQEEAMTVASRIAVINHGKIDQVATPGEIYENSPLALRGTVHRRGECLRGQGGQRRQRHRRYRVARGEFRFQITGPRGLRQGSAGVAGPAAREDPHRIGKARGRRQRHPGQGHRYRLSRLDLALSRAGRIRPESDGAESELRSHGRAQH